MDDELITMACALVRKYEDEMEHFAFQNALAEIFKVISRANKYIDENTPWILAKDEAKRPRLARVMYNLLETVRICAGLLCPFIPETSEEIMRRIGADRYDWVSMAFFGTLPRNATVQGGDPLFPRIDMAKELAALEELQEAARRAAQPALELEPQAEPVAFDDFCKSDLRAVKVKACERVKKSDKLLKFTLDDGTGTDRQILSGIAKWYAPEDLIGKTLLAIINLPPRKIMSRESNGMLLSAVHKVHGEEQLQLVMLDDAIPAGAKLC